MKKLLGKYTGIVIENSGYQRDGSFIPGTVLVKVDGITPRRYTERYKGIPSLNVGGTLDKEMALSYAVPAYIMAPIIGESSMGKYNASSNKSDISDVTTDASGFGGSKISLKPPSAQFDIMNKHCRDKNSDGPAKHATTINNPDGNSYFPDHRYKAGKGVFAIPEINSRVIVEFINGSQSFPVIVGKLNTSDEIEGYYDAGGTKPDYPFFFQNNSKPGTGPSSSSTSDSELPEQYRITDSELQALAAAGYDSRAELYNDNAYDYDLMPVTNWMFGNKKTENQRLGEEAGELNQRGFFDFS
jgi:hypothetical protein